jgi:hypothetical protein
VGATVGFFDERFSSLTQVPSLVCLQPSLAVTEVSGTGVPGARVFTTELVALGFDLSLMVVVG